MTTDEKLQHFLEFTMKDARTRSDQILSDYCNALDKTYEEHKTNVNKYRKDRDERNKALEEAYKYYAELSKYNKEVVDFIDLEYGEYKTEFAECTSFKIDVATRKPIFEYGEKPNPPEIPQTPSLHERVGKLESNEKFQEDMIVDNAYRVALLELSAQGISL